MGLADRGMNTRFIPAAQDGRMNTMFIPTRYAPISAATRFGNSPIRLPSLDSARS